MNRFWTATTGLFALAYALLMFVHQIDAAEIATADTATKATIAPDRIPPVPMSPPYTKFSAFASGTFVTSSNLASCTAVGVICHSGICGGCFTFSDLPLKGLAATRISGEIILENNYNFGFCFQTHGVAKANGPNFAINFVVNGTSCYDPDLSPLDEQFTANYIVQGGTGAYALAAGGGSFTADFPNTADTFAESSLTMNGTIQKAK
jgi:hypothetical protein